MSMGAYNWIQESSSKQAVTSADVLDLMGFEISFKTS